MSLVRAFRLLYELNIIKTIIFNFKMLPFKQAIKLPIFLFGKVYIEESSGKIILDNARLGMVRIGHTTWHELFGKHYTYQTSILKIQGTLKIAGNFLEIGNGCAIAVQPHGVLSLDGQVGIGPHFRILCETNIKIGYHVRISWDAQIFDTNFHFMYDENGVVLRRSAPIEIGDYVWIGNRVTINKGTKIPAHCIVASNSLVNKDFSLCNRGLLAGVPAKYFAINKARVSSFSDEFKIMDYFLAHPEATEYNYGVPEYDHE